ncbi:MAG TPA: cation diffusion facilitator family transporter [Fimbriimonas sp.]
MTVAERNVLTRRAASVSLLYNITLTILKLLGAFLTGSISLLSEAVHSATDIVASTIAYYSVRAASAPPDEEHPYGHGKIESMAGFVESVLLLLIVVYIVMEAVSRLLHGAQVANLDVGIYVMLFSCVTSYGTGRYVSRVGESTESLALRSNGQHLMVDFWTSVGVLGGLLVTRLTGLTSADPLLALALAVWIARNAAKLSYEAYQQLIDRRMEVAEIAKIHETIRDTRGVISYHKLRTRHSGNAHQIDVHIVVPSEWSVVQAHDLADELEQKLSREFVPAVVTIHVDPYDPAKEYPA